MHKIVFLDRESLAEQVVVRRPAFTHAWLEYPQTAAADAAARLQGATIAITNKVRLDAETLAQLPDLRLVAVSATGTDNIYKDYCRAHGVAVSNIRGYAIDTVPEHVFALILALSRSILPYDADVQAGEWGRSTQFCFFDLPIRVLRGARLGIIGCGATT